MATPRSGGVVLHNDDKILLASWSVPAVEGYGCSAFVSEGTIWRVLELTFFMRWARTFHQLSTSMKVSSSQSVAIE